MPLFRDNDKTIQTDANNCEKMPLDQSLIRHWLAQKPACRRTHSCDVLAACPAPAHPSTREFTNIIAPCDRCPDGTRQPTKNKGSVWMAATGTLRT